MKAKLIITDLDQLVNCYDELKEAFDKFGKIQVEYSDKIKKNSRTQAQTNLYYKWLREIGNELGYSEEEAKLVYMEKYLLPLYVKEDISDFQEVAKNMRIVREKVGIEEYNILRQRVIESMSHLDLSVEQMSEYLSSIKLHANTELNIVLTEPSMRGLI